MPILEVEFEVYCSCGSHLCNQSETRSSRTRGTPQIIVAPCEKCLEVARDEGIDEGKDVKNA